MAVKDDNGSKEWGPWVGGPIGRGTDRPTDPPTDPPT